MGLAGTRSAGGVVRLRKLARIGTLALTGMVIVACVALATLTSVSRRHAQRVSHLNDVLRAINAIRIDLTSYGRESGLAYVTGDPQYERSRAVRETDLWAHLADARAVIHQPAKRALLDRASRQMRDYVLLRKEIERRNESPRDVLLAVSPAIEAPLDTLHELSRQGFDDVSNSERRTRRWELLENILGITIAVLVMIGSFAVGMALRRWVFKPLLGLSDGIDRFAAGDRSARVVPDGSEQLRHTADSFNDMAASLERQHQELLTFLAGVAHDLRNPLAAMRMGVQFLEPGPRQVSEDKTRKTLDLIGRQVTRLERMVGDFLDATRIEGGYLQLQLQRRDVRPFVQEAVELYASSSMAHRLRLSEPEKPVEVRCDGARIAQVMNNLVSNAIKYSPGGGEVLLCVSQSGGEAILSVTDSGIGIAPTDLQHIFEPFRRTGASRETAPGVGLGLSVARRIVEAHGGRIEVESTLGAGSTFRVRLPLAGPADAFEPTAASPLH
ncbi:MAG: Chemotaxis protein methyltransferase CheR [Myxococcales bacterium]|nr:Chemotaxis protein methyltransferase CheR [Myxococcales bacterium]